MSTLSSSDTSASAGINMQPTNRLDDDLVRIRCGVCGYPVVVRAWVDQKEDCAEVEWDMPPEMDDVADFCLRCDDEVHTFEGTLGDLSLYEREAPDCGIIR